MINSVFSFYTACASFIGQNWSAGNKKRMLKSYRVSLIYAFIFGAILGGLLLVFGPQFLSLFATEPTVIDAGMQGFVLWHSAMRLAVLWMAVSPHPEVSEKVFRLPLSLSWAPAYFVLSGFIQYLHISRRFHHCIFCISSHGELQDLQKLCFLL